MAHTGSPTSHASRAPRTVQKIVTYKGERRYSKGKASMLRQGWQIQSETSWQRKPSLAHRILTGLFARGRTMFSVTYTRAA